MRFHLLFAGCLAAVVAAIPLHSLAQQPPAGTATAVTTATPPAAPQTPPPAAAAKPAVAATPVAKPTKAAQKVANAVTKKKKKAKDGPITGPIATYPGFRMLDGGGSRVLVTLSKKVTIAEIKGQGKITYRIQGVQVPTRTNRLPLLTTFFSTPVQRAELVAHDEDVDLVIELRTPATPTYRIIDTDKGAELQVDFPKVEADATETKSETEQPASKTAPPSTSKALDSKSQTAY
ncbi:MAG: hypothetical protein IPK82_41120 [Polyangiaceae bacterium]|nr:hypothetical protein [Polyangiaceae bacterium]